MAQCALGRLPPCRFTISKRDLWGLAVVCISNFTRVAKGRANAQDFQRFCHRAVATRMTSANLAKAGWGNLHAHLFAQHLNEHHRASLAISHLVDAFHLGKRSFGQTHALTGLEK